MRADEWLDSLTAEEFEVASLHAQLTGPDLNGVLTWPGADGEPDEVEFVFDLEPPEDG